MICLQETKKEFIDKAMCQAIWGDAEVSWEMQPAINSAGGILCMWCEKSFRLQRKVIGNGFIFLNTLHWWVIYVLCLDSVQQITRSGST